MARRSACLRFVRIALEAPDQFRPLECPDLERPRRPHPVSVTDEDQRLPNNDHTADRWLLESNSNMNEQAAIIALPIAGQPLATPDNHRADERHDVARIFHDSIHFANGISTRS